MRRVASPLESAGYALLGIGFGCWRLASAVDWRRESPWLWFPIYLVLAAPLVLVPFGVANVGLGLGLAELLLRLMHLQRPAAEAPPPSAAAPDGTVAAVAGAEDDEPTTAVKSYDGAREERIFEEDRRRLQRAGIPHRVRSGFGLTTIQVPDAHLERAAALLGVTAAAADAVDADRPSGNG